MTITFNCSNTKDNQPHLTIEYDKNALVEYMTDLTTFNNKKFKIHIVDVNGEQYSKYATGKQFIFFCFPNLNVNFSLQL